MAHILGFLLLLGSTWAKESVAEPSPARSDANNEAVRLGEAGLKALEARDLDAALLLFEAAERSVHSPVFQVLAARVLEAKGHWIRAMAICWAVVHEEPTADWPETWRSAQREAAQRLNRLASEMPKLKVRASFGPWPDLYLDQKRIQPDQWVEVDPGHHVLSGLDPSSGTLLERSFVAKSQQSLVLEWPSSLAALPPYRAKEAKEANAPAAESAPRRPSRNLAAPAVALGIGATGIALGVVAALIALDEKRALDENCREDLCPSALAERAASGRRWAHVATLGLGIGGFGIATAGVVLWLVPSMGPDTSGATAGFAARF